MNTIKEGVWGNLGSPAINIKEGVWGNLGSPKCLLPGGLEPPAFGS
tara:strand:+ start:325 stop:462 length:138 start_codon:yes stop_codon:yes gene_type:complete